MLEPIISSVPYSLLSVINVPLVGNLDKTLLGLAHPQFLKDPSKIRSLERRGDLLGFRAEKFGSSS
ncbi:MAG TPA: hypothetical protein VEL68_09265 [Thermodesulfobacteriota bacterium]|nr:hypothetical protein [Thermodesulfobacteriota bacterium]